MYSRKRTIYEKAMENRTYAISMVLFFACAAVNILSTKDVERGKEMLLLYAHEPVFAITITLLGVVSVVIASIHAIAFFKIHQLMSFGDIDGDIPALFIKSIVAVVLLALFIGLSKTTEVLIVCCAVIAFVCLALSAPKHKINRQ